jgi:hypothetical protein
MEHPAVGGDVFHTSLKIERLVLANSASEGGLHSQRVHVFLERSIVRDCFEVSMI